MTTFIPLTKSSTVQPNTTAKDSATMIAVQKTGQSLWSLSTYPWQESLPWQFATSGSIFTPITKN